MNKIIVAMTSYPARIKTTGKAIFSIIRQKHFNKNFHFVLVLSYEEFPKYEQDLPLDIRLMSDNNVIELIWYKNIKSHKKLMPVLAKYPDNAILVVDDDIIRESDWCETFLKDHTAHPTDIIAGLVLYTLDETTQTFVRHKNFKFGYDCYGKIIKNGRPANGAGGTLYPAHTFTDKRFFDEQLFMSLSPTSDESWQFYFNYKEHKHIRLLSKFYDNRKNTIAGTQEIPTALYKVNKPKYNDIWKNLCKTIK